MPSHFSSIGFNIKSEEDLMRITESLLADAEDIDCAYGRYCKWSDDGIEMWLHFNEKNEFIGLTPAYAGTTQMLVAITAEIESDYPFDGTFHAWLNPDEANPASGDFPFIFDIPDRSCVTDIHLPKITSLRLSAFANDLAVFSNEDEYFNSQSEEPRFAVESFISTGLFIAEDSPGGQPTAMAFFSGRVLASSEKTNPVTGLRYFWAQIKTLGCNIDIVADPSLCGNLPGPGEIVSGSFWLCGSFQRGD